MSDHTPEPLEVRYHGDAVWAGAYPICNLAEPRAQFAHGKEREVKLAHARRIAACWNACAGIPTEALEGADVKALVEAAKRLEPHLDAIICYASTMGEHEPNQIAHDLRAALAPFLKGDTDED